MTGPSGRLAACERAAALLEALQPHFRAIVDQLPALRELRHLAEPPATQGSDITPPRGHAKRPMFSKAAYAGVIQGLLDESGGSLSRDELRRRAERRVVEGGYCRKFLGKWFGEILRAEASAATPGRVATAPAHQRFDEPSLIDLALMEGLDDVA